MLMAICISDFDLYNSMILYPYLYRYFHLLLKFCHFCLLFQADCQSSDFLLFLWGLQILHFYLNSVPPPPHSNLWILLSTLLTIFLIFLSAMLKPNPLGFDLFLSWLPIWNKINHLGIPQPNIVDFFTASSVFTRTAWVTNWFKNWLHIHIQANLRLTIVDCYRSEDKS